MVCEGAAKRKNSLRTLSFKSNSFLQNLEYNVPGGKLNRGMSVVDTVEILKGRPLTDEEHLQAAVLGWGVELVGFQKNLCL